MWVLYSELKEAAARWDSVFIVSLNYIILLSMENPGSGKKIIWGKKKNTCDPSARSTRLGLKYHITCFNLGITRGASNTVDSKESVHSFAVLQNKKDFIVEHLFTREMLSGSPAGFPPASLSISGRWIIFTEVKDSWHVILSPLLHPQRQDEFRCRGRARVLC